MRVVESVLFVCDAIGRVELADLGSCVAATSGKVNPSPEPSFALFHLYTFGYSTWQRLSMLIYETQKLQSSFNPASKCARSMSELGPWSSFPNQDL